MMPANAFIEAFSSKVRREGLGGSLAPDTCGCAREGMEAWRRFFDEGRPNSTVA